MLDFFEKIQHYTNPGGAGEAPFVCDRIVVLNKSVKFC